MSISELKNYILKSKYARHNGGARRRESYCEAVDRVREMMHVKYPIVAAAPVIDWAYDEVLNEVALGSQRAMQYGGEPILRKSARLFNCTSSYADRLRFFQDAFWLLLCGCGVGFSVQGHHVAHLPDFGGGEAERVANPFRMVDAIDCRTFVVPDTIEGWADSLGVLISSYFPGGPFPEYFGKRVDFDFRLIREKGSLLSSGVGRAPGPDPLRNSLAGVRGLLDSCILRGQRRLRPIDAYDIVMMASEAVLAGGVRRSATICVFSPDDVEMAMSKTGDWLQKHPHRARSNNSALLLRDDTTFEQFESMVGWTREYGEPGVIWSDSTEMIPNPCFHPDTLLSTEDGLCRVGDLALESDPLRVASDDRVGPGDLLYCDRKGVSLHDATPVVLTRRQAPIFELKTSHGHSLKVTGDHEFPTLRGRVRLSDMVVGDTILLPSGEGCFGGVGSFDEGFRLGVDESKAGGRVVPDLILRGSRDMVRGYLQGLFLERGSWMLVGPESNPKLVLRIRRYNPSFMRDVQIVLSRFGIVCRIYDASNLSQVVLDYNNTDLFLDRIGVSGGKLDVMKARLKFCDGSRLGPERYLAEVGSITPCGNSDVYCLTQHDTNAVVAQGLVVGQCVEINFWAKLKLDGMDVDEIMRNYRGPIGYDSSDMVPNASGFAFCNLSTINGSKVRTPEDFYRGCRVASALGTLQAGFTDFDYLGPISEEIARRESLLGVSITSIMSNPGVMLDPDVLRRGARIVLETNADVASIIGINPCARGTCVKPEGTSTLMLGSLASGCHGWPFARGIRHVQANRDEVVYRHFQKYNPWACRSSVWSRDMTDDVIAFPVEAPPGAKIQADMDAVEFLDVVKTLYINWVMPGKRPERCTQPWLQHSVSNTVKVKPDEWDVVTRHIYDNRSCFAGVSLLPWSGDRDYEQAPNVAVFTPEEMEVKYGANAVRLLQPTMDRVLDAYDGDLWRACRDLEAGAIPDESERAMAYGVADWFCNNHVGGDRKKFIHLLKDWYYFEQYKMLGRLFMPVPYEDLIEYQDTTTPEQETACSGGACSL